MKKKIIKPTKKSRILTKTVKPWHEEYYNFSTGRIVPVNDTYLEKFGKEFVAWAKQQKHEKKPCTCLEDFYELKEISATTVYRWREKNEKLAQCIQQAKMILGNLRENGVNRKEFSHTLIEKNLHTYKPYWSEVDERWADLKKRSQDDKHSEAINVYIPKLEPDGKPIKAIDKNDYELVEQHKKKDL